MISAAGHSVVHIASSVYGGAGRAAYRLHQALLKDDFKSSFLTLDSDFPYGAVNCFSFKYKHPLFYKRVYNRLKREWISRFGATTQIEQYRIIKQWAVIAPQLKCEVATLPFCSLSILSHPVVQKADIINLHWISGIVDYPTFFERCNKPVVWTLHDMNPFQGIFHYREDEQYNSGIASALDGKVKKIKRACYESLKMPLRIVTPSAWLEKEALASVLFKGFSTVTIPYSLDMDIFSPKPAEQARIDLGLPRERFLLLFIAQEIQSRRKGFDLLFTALQKKRHLPVTVIALGNVVEKNWASIDIRFAGTVKDESVLAAYYSAVNAFVLPSREDNLPNVMLESLACGTPVVGFPVGGIKEHVIPFKTGILAENISADALADSIESLYNNYSSINRMFIRNYAVTHFSHELQAHSYKNVYNALCSRPANKMGVV
jgi:glycosyltransferase involved in cell wall biosynthesis